MKYRQILVMSVAILGSLLGVAEYAAEVQHRRPDIILVVADHLGYGDVGCYGSKLSRTPRLDRMAVEGMRFTDFHVASAMCTPSRAALQTRCDALRVGMGRPPNTIRRVNLIGEATGLPPTR